MTLKMITRCLGCAIGGLALLAPGIARAQTTTAAATPSTDATSDAPANATSQPQVGEGLVYEVNQISGKALVAPIGMDPVKDAAQWRPVQLGEALGRGQQIRTLPRARVKLVARPADPPTVILLESVTRMTIEELAIRDGQAVSRLALGYGAIRAGVAEGQTRSDMQIASPSAVLSKKGTDIFRVEYHNGRFNMSLSEQGRGLLQAIQLQFSNRGNVVGFKSRLVTPGQAVTQRMAQAIESMTWDREINVNDMFGLVGNDRLFTMLNDRGFGFLLPFSSTTANIFGGATQTQNPGGNVAMTTNPFSVPSQGVRPITDGDFGIGQGTLPDFFGSLRARSAAQDRQRMRVNSFKNLARQRSRPRFDWSRHRK